VGYAKNGRIQIYNESKENKRIPYTLTKALNIKNGDDIEDVMIRDMSVSPSADQENLICLTTTNLIYKIKLEKDQEDIEEPKFEMISSQAHEGEITAMDICIRKPLIVTCGSDRYIRIWNYQEKCQELSKNFQADEVFSVALHPSGFHLLVGLSDKLNYFNIGTARGEVFRKICGFNIRTCPEVRFSNGGQYFAAVV